MILAVFKWRLLYKSDNPRRVSAFDGLFSGQKVIQKWEQQGAYELGSQIKVFLTHLHNKNTHKPLYFIQGWYLLLTKILLIFLRFLWARRTGPSSKVALYRGSEVSCGGKRTILGREKASSELEGPTRILWNCGKHATKIGRDLLSW